jgi:glycine betaine/proline transport system substrate-binding protein
LLNFNWKKLILITMVSVMFFIVGCGNNNTESSINEDGSTNYSKAVDYTIIGIEPGAGITQQAKETLEEYENLAGWELQESSTAGMLAELENAIKNKDPIIITGWNPHYKFSQYNLKYLEDPKGSIGGEESIHTIVRKGLKEDMPNAYKILNQFHWDVKDMESVMLEAQETSFEEAAKNWIKANQDKVTQWIKDTEPVNGKSIELVSTPWDTERASSEVLKQVLEKQGFNVKVTPVDPAVVFQAIADGEADASQAPWLPSTHKPFYEKYKDDIVDLGENLKGTRTGLVVPTYMNIDSIDDLQPKDG